MNTPKFDAKTDALETVLLISHGGYLIDEDLNRALQHHIANAVQKAYEQGKAFAATRRENVKAHAEAVLREWNAKQMNTSKLAMRCEDYNYGDNPTEPPVVMEAEKQEITDAGCDPDDPDSHDWRRMGESHTADGRTIGYRCSRCGAEDSS